VRAAAVPLASRALAAAETLTEATAATDKIARDLARIAKASGDTELYSLMVDIYAIELAVGDAFEALIAPLEFAVDAGCHLPSTA
jgi:hypothetical protein